MNSSSSFSGYSNLDEVEPQTQQPAPTASWYLASFLLPFLGFVLGFVAIGRGHAGAGMALFLTSIASAVVLALTMSAI